MKLLKLSFLTYAADTNGDEEEEDDNEDDDETDCLKILISTRWWSRLELF